MNWNRHKLPALLMLMIVVYSCASMGNPDGGPYDEEPPKFVRSTPKPFAINSKEKKVTIEFDEFIKLEKAAEKVVVSPPQLEQPEIKASGRKVVVGLVDSLRPNTTYTIDFADAIVDNNEGNPLGNYAFTFSTGTTIDTMEVSGTVLSASDLEPVKNIQVGLHSDLSDSAFMKKPFDRVSRTDSRGHFSIRGIAPGKYRIYALMDGNQNYLFDSKTEMIAFSDSIIIPAMEDAMRQDTIWKDSLTIDTIKSVGYTRFLPDDIILRAFKEENDRQYLTRSERAKEKVIDLACLVADYAGAIKLHVVNFADVQMAIYDNCPHEELTIIMKRYMIKIAEELAKRNDCQCTVTGESIGQVSSQTVFSLAVINDVSTLPVFRPCIGLDKQEIVDISEKIGTYETSILPYEDCCTTFVAKHPVTKPILSAIEKSEAKLAGIIEPLYEKALESVETVMCRSQR